MRTSRGTVVGALLLAVSLLALPSYAGATDRADGAPTRALDVRAEPRKPLVRIGQLLGSSPTEKYRFRGTKGQRVILMPDSWPEDSHGCLSLAGMRLDGRKLPQGSVGDWRLPRTATYDLRVGRFCVEELDLRLRRHEQPRARVGGKLSTRFTRTLLRSPRLTLPPKGSVIFEQPGEGQVHLAPSRSKWPWLGCEVHVATFGRRLCSVSGTMTREVVVSAPVPGRTRRAKVVDVTVGGPAVTIEDPSRTLVRVGLDAGAAVTIETNAVPVPRTLAQRDWVELTAPTRGWTTAVNTYRTRSSGETWVPSGWTVSKSGSYAFQLVDQGAAPAREPLTFAVRASTNPPPGELEPVESPYDDRVSAARQARATKPRLRIGQLLEPSPTQRYRFKGRKGQRVILQPDMGPGMGHGCVGDERMFLGSKRLKQGSIGDFRLPRTATYELRVGRFCVDRMPLRLRRHQQPRVALRGPTPSALPTRFTRTLMRSVRLTLPKNRAVLLGEEAGSRPVQVASVQREVGTFVGCDTTVTRAGDRWTCGPGLVPREVLVSAPGPSTAVTAKVVDATVDGPPVTITDPGRTLVRVEVAGRAALRVESNATPVPHTLVERDWVELAALDGRYWYDVSAYRTRASEDDHWLPSGWVVDEPGQYAFQVVDPASWPASEALTLAVRTSVDPPPGEVEEIVYPD